MEQELLTIPDHLSSLPVFSGVRVTRYVVLCVCFVDRCLSFYFWPLCCLSFFCWPLYCLSFFFWPLCCLSFFDLRILIIPLVSSNSSSMLQLGDNCIVYEDLSASIVDLKFANLCTGVSKQLFATTN